MITTIRFLAISARAPTENAAAIAAPEELPPGMPSYRASARAVSNAAFITHGPVAGFILQQAWVASFTEPGGFTSLSYGDQIREVSVLGYQANFDSGMWHPFAQVVWDHEFDPLNRVVTASLTTLAAPSYSMPAVVLGRDWVAATVGSQVTITRSWSALASFTVQLGQQNVTNYGGLIGLNYAFAAPPQRPLIVKN